MGTPGRRHRRLIPAHAGKTCLRGSAVGPRPAHPRSRGENRDMGGTVPPRPGSSPLTRGKPPDGSRATANRRLIPAHAGKTAAPPPPISTRTAHPRSRGENAIPCISSCTICGSSPLTRGKLEAHSEWRAAPGLIPAHAGKTLRVLESAANRTAHPRSRGENLKCGCLGVAVLGSSPLTRGKPEASGRHSMPIGLIPAHAGKTQCLTAA